MYIGDKKLKNVFYRVLTHIFCDDERKRLKSANRYIKSIIDFTEMDAKINFKIQKIKAEQRKAEIENINNLKTSEEILKYIAIQKVNEKYNF